MCVMTHLFGLVELKCDHIILFHYAVLLLVLFFFTAFVLLRKKCISFFKRTHLMHVGMMKQKKKFFFVLPVQIWLVEWTLYIWNMIFYLRYFAVLLPYRCNCLKTRLHIILVCCALHNNGMRFIKTHRLSLSYFSVHFNLNIDMVCPVMYGQNWMREKERNETFEQHLCRVSCSIFFCFPSYSFSILNIFLFPYKFFFSCYVIVFNFGLIQRCGQSIYAIPQIVCIHTFSMCIQPMYAIDE